MPEIIETGLADVLGELPEITQWQPSKLKNSKIDILICCAGFEDRARAILSDVKDLEIQNSFVVVYPTNLEDNLALTEFREHKSIKKCVEINYDRDSFLVMIRDMLRELEQLDTPRIVIDLSGMASYIIYRVLSVVFDLFPQGELGIYYSEADQYFPLQSEWEDFFNSLSNPEDNLAVIDSYEKIYFQSIGVDVTYESDIAPGQNPDPLTTQIVAIPSFSLQRMKSMLAYAENQYGVYPKNVRWFLGQPPDQQKNGWRSDALAALYNVKDNGIAVSTLNYIRTLQELDCLWEETHIESHTVIANLGSKMQHLATFLYLQMHPECGLLISEPESFKASAYSSGCGSKWWLDFGNIGLLKTLLNSRGKLKFKW